MRIEVAHAQALAYSWSAGAVRIGAAPDNDVCLVGKGVAPRHVTITADARGLILDVCPGTSRVYVNARPVRERALLHVGDSLGLGGHQLCLAADALPDVPVGEPVDAVRDAVVDLRGVAGPLSGRVFALHERLDLDASGPVDFPVPSQTTVLRKDGAYVDLDAQTVPAALMPTVNGIKTRSARLMDGDQLVLGGNRFILDLSASPVPPREPVAAATADAPPAVRGWHPEVWLVVTAAVLALVLVGVMLLHY